MNLRGPWIALLFIFSNCNNNQKQTTGTIGEDSTVQTYTPKTGLDAEPLLRETDSLEIIYYDDPDGDPERYTRFYKYRVTSDSFIINSMVKELNQPFEQQNGIRDCRSEGKMYLFSRKEPLKTLYFSTRCDTCCYLYYIKDGNFLYFSISDKFSEIIRTNRKQAIAP